MVNGFCMVVCPECGQVNVVTSGTVFCICPVCATNYGIENELRVELTG